jgi:hypothetical protein
MKRFLKAGKLSTIALFAIIGLSFNSSESDIKYKCMIQMVNYIGENAYVVVSLMKPDGTYDKTLHVAGKDDEWYHDIIKWWGHQKTAKDKLDGITGASIAGGQRSIALIKIPATKIDKGYKLRFESAVEGQTYHAKDIEIDMTATNVNQKFDGKGYIRYVRLIPG